MNPSPYTCADFEHSPFLVFYEVTRACDLACRHCRASAHPATHPEELDTAQAKRLFEQLASFPKRPLLVFTGGDPLKRRDLIELVAAAAGLGLATALTPSATPLVTGEALAALHSAGLRRLAVSLDGADEATHDDFRGTPGSFNRTLRIMAASRGLGLPMQVNTALTRRNVGQVDALANLLATQEIVLWSVFFLVPVGRGVLEERISAEACERVFERLWKLTRSQPYAIKTTEAPHYRRFVLQRGGDLRYAPPGSAPQERQRGPLGVNDGKGVLFVSHTGHIYPSGFLPLSCGRFPEHSVVEVYRNAPLFRALRDHEQLKGKCGACEYRSICGGSRARAFAVTGDPLAAEPDCAYRPPGWQPPGWREEEASDV